MGTPLKLAHYVVPSGAVEGGPSAAGAEPATTMCTTNPRTWTTRCSRCYGSWDCGAHRFLQENCWNCGGFEQLEPIKPMEIKQQFNPAKVAMYLQNYLPQMQDTASVQVKTKDLSALKVRNNGKE